MMTWIIAICSTAIAIGSIATWRLARGQRWRWGSVRVRGPEVGDGPFRSAAVIMERPRRMPMAVPVASAISVGWGALTLFLFAPLGILLSAVALPGARHGVLAAMGGLGAAASTLSGFAIGVRMLAVSKSLVVRTADSAERVRSVAIHAALHHVLVFGTVTAIHGGTGSDPEIVAFSAVPCAIGMGVAALLAVAGWALRRLDRVDATAAI